MFLRRISSYVLLPMILSACSTPAAVTPPGIQEAGATAAPSPTPVGQLTPTALAPRQLAELTPVAPSPTAAVEPTVAAPSPTATVESTAAAPLPTATAEPTAAAPVATAAPSPALAPAAAGVPPTATPQFPTREINTRTVAELTLLRTVGVGKAYQAILSPDKSRLIVATTGGLVFYDAVTFEQQRFIPLDGEVYELGLSDDSADLELIMFGHPDMLLERRQFSDGALVDRVPSTVKRPDTYITVFDSPSGTFQAHFRYPDASPTPGVNIKRVADGSTLYEDWTSEVISFSADESMAVLVTYDGTVQLLDLATWTTRALPVPEFWGATFSPDGQKLVTSGRDLFVWDVVSGELEASYPLEGIKQQSDIVSGDQRIRYTPDQSALTIDAEYGVFELLLRQSSSWKQQGSGLAHQWDMELETSNMRNFATYVAALSPRSQAGAITEDGFTLQLYRGTERYLGLEHAARITAMEYSPTEPLLAVADQMGTIELIQESDGTVVETFKGEQAVGVLGFDPSGTLLAAHFEDGTIRVWRRGSDQPIATLKTEPISYRPSDGAGSLVFTSDQRMLIVRAADGHRFFDLESEQLVHTLPGSVQQLAIGPRQRAIATLSRGYVQLWGLR